MIAGRRTDRRKPLFRRRTRSRGLSTLAAGKNSSGSVYSFESPPGSLRISSRQRFSIASSAVSWEKESQASTTAYAKSLKRSNCSRVEQPHAEDPHGPFPQPHFSVEAIRPDYRVAYSIAVPHQRFRFGRVKSRSVSKTIAIIAAITLSLSVQAVSCQAQTRKSASLIPHTI